MHIVPLPSFRLKGIFVYALGWVGFAAEIHYFSLKLTVHYIFEWKKKREKNNWEEKLNFSFLFCFCLSQFKFISASGHKMMHINNKQNI